MGEEGTKSGQELHGTSIDFPTMKYSITHNDYISFIFAHMVQYSGESCTGRNNVLPLTRDLHLVRSPSVFIRPFHRDKCQCTKRTRLLRIDETEVTGAQVLIVLIVTSSGANRLAIVSQQSKFLKCGLQIFRS